MPKKHHSYIEDLVAIITGALFVSLGVYFFNQVGLLTGGTAGIALLLTKLSSFTFGQVFFLVNIPFYFLAIKQMGWRFTLNTFISVGLVSVMSDYAGLVLQVGFVNPAYAAVAGGLMIGVGMLIMFRHRSSLGGLGILAFYLQERYSVRAGKFQMAVDLCILLASLFVVPTDILVLSILGATALNAVIAMNHKPGRYQIT